MFAPGSSIATPLARPYLRSVMRVASLVAILGLTACSGSLDAPGGTGGTGANPPGTGGSTTPGSGGSGAVSTGGSSSATGGSGATVGSGATGGTNVATGGTGTATGGSGGSTPPADCQGAAADTGASVLRRLSNLEYQLTLQDLFELTSVPTLEGIPEAAATNGFELAEKQSVSALALRGYLDKATELGKALLADQARRTSVIGCDVAQASCLTSFVTSFGKLAYRRPLDSDEVSAITAAAEEHAVDAADRFVYAIEALLTSPSFLFRVEVGTATEGLAELTPFELASKLSFGVLGRAPSAELLDQAASGGLDTPQGLQTAARNLLADPRSQSFFGAFFRRWLGYDTLRAPVPPPSGWSNTLLADMQAETDGILRDFAWGSRNFLEALTTNTTRLSPGLARFYDLPAPAADGTLTIPAEHVRAGTGLLTHASLLSAKRDGDLIAVRGNWVRNAFLCEHLDAVDLSEIAPNLEGLGRVEIVRMRNSQPSCTGCHALIDPIGVGFDQFDGTGRFDAELPVNDYGVATAIPEVTNGEFGSVAELAQKLSALPQVPACITERTFLFVNAREPAAADACEVQGLANAFAAGSYDFQALVEALVASPAFRLRRAPAAPL